VNWIEQVRKLQRPWLVFSLSFVVGYLALIGQDWAQDIVKGAFLLLIGHLFGERAARNGGK